MNHTLRAGLVMVLACLGTGSASAEVTHLVFGLPSTTAFDVAKDGNLVGAGLIPSEQGNLLFEADPPGEILITPSGTGDLIPPAPVTDLAVIDSTEFSLTFRFTATGDDGMEGTAALFQARISTGPLNEETWSQAYAIPGLPAPGPAGSVVEFTCTGLSPGTSWNVAVKMADEFRNWSSLSNVAAGRTTVPPPPPPPNDTTSPSALTDLAVIAADTSSITFRWTVTGDDGQEGTAAVVELRSSPQPITELNWPASSVAASIPVTGPAGTVMTGVATGLTPDTTLFFAARVADEVPNWSLLSNSLQTSTNSADPPPPPPPPPPAEPDTIPPAAVADLAATGADTSSISLAWTVRGDDGDTGRAALAEVRFSSAPLNAENWSAAQVGAQIPVSGDAGSAMTATVSGLASGHSYYFGVKLADEVPNWSDLENVITAMTDAASQPPPPPEDTVPPAAVIDLAATGRDTTSITLAWTVHGDDGDAGRAVLADLRSSSEPITNDNWPAAEQVALLPVPGSAGTRMTATVEGLSPARSYYFAVRLADEVPNWSALGHVLLASTDSLPEPADGIAPSAVADLAAAASSTTGITLTWTAPGDDGSTGSAAAYDIRVSPDPITEGNWAGAGPVLHPEPPRVAGQPESFEVGGLSPNTLYRIRLRARDEAGNESALSNEAVVRTEAAPDDAPPFPVADLAAMDSTTSSLRIRWTAPRDSVPPGAEGTGAIAAFDLRMSRVPLTDANWNEAATVSAPAPSLPGTTVEVTVGELTPGVVFYFGLRSSDAAGNPSGLSNILVAATRREVEPPPPPPPPPPSWPDTLPPAPVTTLEAALSGERAIHLAWQAVGDDGLTGTAARTVIRFSTAPMDAESWESADSIAGAPAPADPGTWQSFEWPDRERGLTYYAAVRVADEAGNLSELGNVVSVSVPPDPDEAPLLAPSGLEARWDGSAVLLSWAASSSPEVNGYRVLRRRSDAAESRVVADEVRSESWSDADVIEGLSYGYTVSARDARGRISPACTEVWIRITQQPDTSQSTQLVLAVEYARAEAPNELRRIVALEWSAGPAEGSAPLSGFRIYREPQEARPRSLLSPLTPSFPLIPDSLRGARPHRFEAALPPAGAWRFWIEAVSADGASSFWLDPMSVVIAEPASGVIGIWPNPTSGPVRIRWSSTVRAESAAAIFDATGRKILELTRGETGPGDGEWLIPDLRRACGSDLPSGVYFLRLRSGMQENTARFVLGRGNRD